MVKNQTILSVCSWEYQICTCGDH